MNPNDKHALESALLLKEKLGCSVHVISLGSENSIKILREAIAMGVDTATRIDTGDLGYLSPLAKGEILAQAVKKIGNFDLILLGMASNDYGQSQLPSIIAAKLLMSQVTYADSLEIENNFFIGDRYVEGGTIKIKVKIPCVVSVASTANEPRYTSVKRILIAKKTEIPVINLKDLDINIEDFDSYCGLKLNIVEKPETDEIEVFKVDEGDDIELGVEKLLSKLKTDGIELGGLKQ